MYVYMSACMYVCLFVSLYVYMYVSMHACIYALCMYRVYQNDLSGFEVDYIHKYGEQNYKYQ